MNQYYESALIALDAIWSSKLRSLMTVLGNIVAVTSIIAVVSLITGLNSSVKELILRQAGADSFNIQQFPITRSDEERDKVRNNPRISMLDAQAIRKHSTLITAVMADTRAGGRITYRDASIDGIQVTGVTPEYINFSNYDAERGRLMSPTEVDLARPVAVIGAQTAERLFGPDIEPLEKTIQIQGVHFRVVGVSAKRGALLGQSQDEFAIIPLGEFQQIFGSRRQLTMSVKPRDLAQITPAIDDATVALRIARRMKPSKPGVRPSNARCKQDRSRADPSVTRSRRAHTRAGDVSSALGPISPRIRLSVGAHGREPRLARASNDDAARTYVGSSLERRVISPSES